MEPFTLALVAFLVTIDPIGMVPIFLALTNGMDSPARRSAAVRGVGIGAVLLLLFALLGDGILTTLGIGMPAFRIAGGLMLLVIAMEMVFEHRTQRRSDSAEHLRDERQRDDIAAFPLGIPLIAGPGAITATILHMSAHEDSFYNQALVLLAMAIALGLLLGLLLLSVRLAAYLRPALVSLLSRLLGLLLAALAVQYVIDGVRQAIAAA